MLAWSILSLERHCQSALYKTRSTSWDSHNPRVQEDSALQDNQKLSALCHTSHTFVEWPAKTATAHKCRPRPKKVNHPEKPLLWRCLCLDSHSLHCTLVPIWEVVQSCPCSKIYSVFHLLLWRNIIDWFLHEISGLLPPSVEIVLHFLEIRDRELDFRVHRDQDFQVHCGDCDGRTHRFVWQVELGMFVDCLSGGGISGISGISGIYTK